MSSVLTTAEKSQHASTILERMNNQAPRVSGEENFFGSIDIGVERIFLDQYIRDCLPSKIDTGVERTVLYNITHGRPRRVSFSKDPIAIEIANIDIVAYWSSEPMTKASIDSKKRIVQLLSRPETVEEVIRDLRLFGHDRYADRINFLHKNDDFEEGEKPLSPESAKSFLRFIGDIDHLDEFRDTDKFLLGLSHTGTLGVTWVASDEKRLHMDFHEDHFVSFAIIDQKKHLNGRVSREEMPEFLRKNCVTSWQQG